MGFASESRERTRPAIPLAAMVDIIFLLLIFFMTIAAFRAKEREIDVELQQIASTGSGSSPTAIIVTVRADGSLYLGERPHSPESLMTTLRELADQWSDEQVIVRADKTSASGRLLQAIDIARDAGFLRVSLAGAEGASP